MGSSDTADYLKSRTYHPTIGGNVAIGSKRRFQQDCGINRTSVPQVKAPRANDHSKERTRKFKENIVRYMVTCIETYSESTESQQ